MAVFSVLLLLFGARSVAPCAFGSEPSGEAPSTQTLKEHSVLTHGQLATLFWYTASELDGQLPDGAGDAIHQLMENYAKTTKDFSGVTLKQLKEAAKPIYDLLIEVGYTDNYPWVDSSEFEPNTAPATIAQGKRLLVFDLTSVDAEHDADGDGIPDWWEHYYFGPWYGMDGTAADEDWDSDGYSNAQEYVHGTDPTDAFNGSPPKLLIIEGGDQRDLPGTKLPMPLAVRADDAKYDNAPITFRVTSGKALLVPISANDVAHPPSAELTVPASELMTESTGLHRIAWVSIILPDKPADSSIIEVSAKSQAGIMKVSTTATSANPSLPSPKDLKVTNNPLTSATLTWTPGDPAQQTTIEASKDEEATWFTLAAVAPGIRSVTVTGLALEQNPVFRVYTGGDKSPIEGAAIQWPYPTKRGSELLRREAKIWRQERWRAWQRDQPQEPQPLRPAPLALLHVLSDPLECSTFVQAHAFLVANDANRSDAIYRSLRASLKTMNDRQKDELGQTLTGDIIGVLTATATPNEHWSDGWSLRGRACTLAGFLKLEAASSALVQLLEPLPGQRDDGGYHKIFDEATPEGCMFDSPAIEPLIQIGQPAEPALWEALRANRGTLLDLALQNRSTPQPTDRKRPRIWAESRKGSYIRYILEKINALR